VFWQIFFRYRMPTPGNLTFFFFFPHFLPVLHSRKSNPFFSLSFVVCCVQDPPRLVPNSLSCYRTIRFPWDQPPTIIVHGPAGVVSVFACSRAASKSMRFLAAQALGSVQCVNPSPLSSRPSPLTADFVSAVCVLDPHFSFCSEFHTDPPNSRRRSNVFSCFPPSQSLQGMSIHLFPFSPEILAPFCRPNTS